MREDAEHLPKFEGKLNKFKDAVRDRVIEDERRLFYVSLTRAKQRLAVTASWWYGRDKKEKGPSQFWDELAELEKQGLLDVRAARRHARGEPAVRRDGGSSRVAAGGAVRT